ncbi:MAG TPA: hypothetical protein VK633_14095, partial [Verrucomicrobiae bacterium]|nr:hypothetical protein [Verrucomicrobiae bacterium]
VCMLKASGCSVAFQPKTRNVRAAAKYRTNRLVDVLLFSGVRSLRHSQAQASPSPDAEFPELLSN